MFVAGPGNIFAEGSGSATEVSDGRRLGSRLSGRVSWNDWCYFLLLPPLQVTVE